MDSRSRVNYGSAMTDAEPRAAMLARLERLDALFTWLGQANRRDLVHSFGISNAQAALDFRAYFERVEAPAPIYDPVRKTYLADPHHKGLPGRPPSGTVEALFAAAHGGDFARLPGPSRQCPPAILRQLNQAIERRQYIEIDYVSMTTGRHDRQWIAPAHVASDGERLHVRAWSCVHDAWRDYLPVRVSIDSSFATKPVTAPLPADEDWDAIIQIRLRPRSDLSSDQQSAVRLEYGFEGDDLVIETRRALEFYIDRRWGLDRKGARLERC